MTSEDDGNDEERPMRVWALGINFEVQHGLGC